MVRESVGLLELLRKQAAGGDLDFLREAVAVLAEAVMEAEVSAHVGADYGERSEMRTSRRNGYRPRRWDTRVGSIDLQIPKAPTGETPHVRNAQGAPPPGQRIGASGARGEGDREQPERRARVVIAAVFRCRRRRRGWSWPA